MPWRALGGTNHPSIVSRDRVDVDADVDIGVDDDVVDAAYFPAIPFPTNDSRVRC